MDRSFSVPILASRRAFSLALGGALVALTAGRADAAARGSSLPAAVVDAGVNRPILSVLFVDDTSPIQIDVLDMLDRVTHTFKPVAGSYVYGLSLPRGTSADPRSSRKLMVTAFDTSSNNAPVAVVAVPGGSYTTYGIGPRTGTASQSGAVPYAAVLTIAYGS